MDKKEIIDLVELFGLYVDLDKWDDAGWLRIQSGHCSTPNNANQQAQA